MPDSPSRPLCLLLPGLTGTAAFYPDLAHDLTPDVEPRIVTYPNRALPYEDLCETILPDLPTDRPYAMIAESFAGPLAILLAVRALRKPTHMILTATFASNPWPATGWLRQAFLPFMTPQIMTPSFIATTLLGSGTHHLADQVHEEIQKLAPGVLQSRIRAVLTCDVRTALKSLDLPIVYLQGRQDRLVPASCATAMQDIKPDMIIHRVDAAHFVLQDKTADLTRDIILPFLKT